MEPLEATLKAAEGGGRLASAPAAALGGAPGAASPPAPIGALKRQTSQHVEQYIRGLLMGAEEARRRAVELETLQLQRDGILDKLANPVLVPAVAKRYDTGQVRGDGGRVDEAGSSGRGISREAARLLSPATYAERMQQWQSKLRSKSAGRGDSPASTGGSPDKAEALAQGLHRLLLMSPNGTIATPAMGLRGAVVTGPSRQPKAARPARSAIDTDHRDSNSSNSGYRVIRPQRAARAPGPTHSLAATLGLGVGADEDEEENAAAAAAAAVSSPNGEYRLYGRGIVDPARWKAFLAQNTRRRAGEDGAGQGYDGEDKGDDEDDEDAAAAAEAAGLLDGLATQDVAYADVLSALQGYVAAAAAAGSSSLSPRPGSQQTIRRKDGSGATPASRRRAMPGAASGSSASSQPSAAAADAFNLSGRGLTGIGHPSLAEQQDAAAVAAVLAQTNALAAAAGAAGDGGALSSPRHTIASTGGGLVSPEAALSVRRTLTTADVRATFEALKTQAAVMGPSHASSSADPALNPSLDTEPSFLAAVTSPLPPSRVPVPSLMQMVPLGPPAEDEGAATSLPTPSRRTITRKQGGRRRRRAGRAGIIRAGGEARYVLDAEGKPVVVYTHADGREETVPVGASDDDDDDEDDEDEDDDEEGGGVDGGYGFRPNTAGPSAAAGGRFASFNDPHTEWDVAPAAVSSSRRSPSPAHADGRVSPSASSVMGGTTMSLTDRQTSLYYRTMHPEEPFNDGESTGPGVAAASGQRASIYHRDLRVADEDGGVGAAAAALLQPSGGLPGGPLSSGREPLTGGLAAFPATGAVAHLLQGAGPATSPRQGAPALAPATPGVAAHTEAAGVSSSMGAAAARVLRLAAAPAGADESAPGVLPVSLGPASPAGVAATLQSPTGTSAGIARTLRAVPGSRGRSTVPGSSLSPRLSPAAAAAASYEPSFPGPITPTQAKLLHRTLSGARRPRLPSHPPGDAPAYSSEDDDDDDEEDEERDEDDEGRSGIAAGISQIMAAHMALLAQYQQNVGGMEDDEDDDEDEDDEDDDDDESEGVGMGGGGSRVYSYRGRRRQPRRLPPAIPEPPSPLSPPQAALVPAPAAPAVAAPPSPPSRSPSPRGLRAPVSSPLARHRRTVRAPPANAAAMDFYASHAMRGSYVPSAVVEASAFTMAVSEGLLLPEGYATASSPTAAPVVPTTKTPPRSKATTATHGRAASFSPLRVGEVSGSTGSFGPAAVAPPASSASPQLRGSPAKRPAGGSAPDGGGDDILKMLLSPTSGGGGEANSGRGKGADADLAAMLEAKIRQKREAEAAAARAGGARGGLASPPAGGAAAARPAGPFSSTTPAAPAAAAVGEYDNDDDL